MIKPVQRSPLGHNQGEGVELTVKRKNSALLTHGHILQAGLIQPVFNCLCGFLPCNGFKEDFRIIGHDITELPDRNTADAVADGEAHYHQHTATRNADNGDQNTVFIRHHIT